MDDFEKAILVVFSPSPEITPAVREQATAYLDAIRRQSDACEFCWTQFVQRDRLELKFWCLQTVSGAIGFATSQQRVALRAKLLTWLRDSSSCQSEDVAIKNKIALIYVGLLKLDYPASWPSAWLDVILLCEAEPRVVDMLLRIQLAFDQEVVSDELQHTSGQRENCQIIKQHMRDSDVPRLVECWLTVLLSLYQSLPTIVRDCLKVIGLFAIWIDFTFLINDRVLSAICSIIADGSVTSYEACDCLGILLGKKMLAGQKLKSLQNACILQRLESCCLHRSSSDLKLLEKEAELWNSAAEAILEAYVEIRQHPDKGEAVALAQVAWDILTAMMPTIFWFFGRQEYQMADSIEPFLTALFGKVRDITNIDVHPTNGPWHVVSMDQLKPIMQQSLQLILQRIVYPDWFQHDDAACEDDEYHITFLELRRSLTKLHKRIFLIDHDMVLDFMQASVFQLTHNVSVARPMEAEAVLLLFRETGDYIGDLVKYCRADVRLSDCFTQIIQCDKLLRSDHWAVQLALLDIHVRYAKILNTRPDLFSTSGQRILESIVGSQGIQAHDNRVVARASFIFGRFVKTLKTQMGPLAPLIYNHVKELLVVPYIPSSLILSAGSEEIVRSVVVKGSLKFDDQKNLYEAIASLIASLPEDRSVPAVRTLLEGPVAQLTEIVGVEIGRLVVDLPGYTIWAARCVEVIATVSKSFSAKHKSSSSHWENVINVVAHLLEKISGTKSHNKVSAVRELWQASLFLCRRMVEILGESFLGPLDAILPLLYADADQAGLTELCIFTQHVVAQLKQKSQALLVKRMPMWFGCPFDIWKDLSEDSEELKRERATLAYHLLELVKECGQRCPLVLLEPLVFAENGNGSRGQQVIQFLLANLHEPGEIRTFFFATATWSALLETAVGDPAMQTVLASLPLVQLLQEILRSTARMDFNENHSQKVLAEVASVLRCLTSARLLPQGSQQQAFEALQKALVGALPGLRTDDAPRKLLEALSQDCSLKEIRSALQQCVFDWRRDSGA